MTLTISSLLSRTAVATALLSFGLGTLSLTGSGCGDTLDEGATSGKRVVLGTRVESADDLHVPSVNARGWTISWSRVLVSVSALYYYDGAPPSLARSVPSPAWKRWIGIPVAHAHPGHYQAGNAMGQMLTASSFDLAQGPTALSPGEGVTGTYRSGTFLFGSPAQGPHAADLGSDVIVVEGTASQGAETRMFRARASAADVTNASGTIGVDGCVFEEAAVKGDGTVVLRVRPSVWLGQVDFTDVPVSSGAPVDLPGGGPAQQAFTLLGVSRASAYVFSFDPGPG